MISSTKLKCSHIILPHSVKVGEHCVFRNFCGGEIGGAVILIPSSLADFDQALQLPEPGILVEVQAHNRI
jgi:hypothetical protein